MGKTVLSTQKTQVQSLAPYVPQNTARNDPGNKPGVALSATGCGHQTSKTRYLTINTKISVAVKVQWLKCLPYMLWSTSPQGWFPRTEQRVSSEHCWMWFKIQKHTNRQKYTCLKIRVKHHMVWAWYMKKQTYILLCWHLQQPICLYCMVHKWYKYPNSFWQKNSSSPFI